MKVLGIGNALVDVLIQLPNEELLNQLNLPKGSMQLVDTDFVSNIYTKTEHLPKTIASGGSAANTIHGMAKLGAQVGYIGKIGVDTFGQNFADDMQSNGATPILSFGKTETGRAMALITPDGERTFATFLGAAVELCDNDININQFIGFNILHLEGYLVFNHNLVEKACKLAKQNNMLISIDLASFNVVEANLEFITNIIKNYIDIVFANEEEAKALTGLEPHDAVNEISKMANIAVVKVGAEGSFIKRDNEFYKVNAIKANCIDTTGAGDLFAAGFLFGLINNKALDTCAHYGSITAGNVVETLGAKMNSNTWNKIYKLIQEKG